MRLVGRLRVVARFSLVFNNINKFMGRIMATSDNYSSEEYVYQSVSMSSLFKRLSLNQKPLAHTRRD